MHTVSNIRVGNPETSPSKPTHQPGVRQGNRLHGPLRGARNGDGDVLPSEARARRSTGINAKAREPIDPRMPDLTPA